MLWSKQTAGKHKSKQTADFKNSMFFFINNKQTAEFSHQQTDFPKSKYTADFLTKCKQAADFASKRSKQIADLIK